MDYLVYFLGPLVLAAVGARVLRLRFSLMFVGCAAFLLAWVVMQTVTGIATKGFHVAETSFLYGLIASLLAGVVEESTRYVVFRQFSVFHGTQRWNSSLSYALGHHGMETVIIGLTLLLIWAVVKYKPDAISDPTTLRQCQEVLALGTGVKLYNATERLFVGLLIHACFSGVVMLCFVRGGTRWLFVAMGWHFLHDMVGFNLHRLAPHWVAGKAWVAIIVLGYSYLVVRIYRALQPPDPAAPAAPPAGPGPMLLPGRPG